MSAEDLENAEMIEDFVAECTEYLDKVERDLVLLENNPSDQSLIDSIFRSIHTIKGNGGYLGLARLERLAHAAESLLSRVRGGGIMLTVDGTTAVLGAVDALRNMVRHVEQGGSDGEEEYSSLLDTLSSLEKTGRVDQVDIASIRMSEADDHDDGVETSLRVEVAVLDKLMTQVGELVLARNQVLQYASLRNDPSFTATTHRLNLITSELQEGIMKTRMQPVANIWHKFPRLVRDHTRSSGKLIGLQMEGRNTEIDKTIIEAIKSPMTHLVRNAVDHGIEPPAERVAAGRVDTPPGGVPGSEINQLLWQHNIVASSKIILN